MAVRKFRFVREDLRRSHTRYARSGALLLALGAVALGLLGALRQPPVLATLLGLAVALALVALYERRIEARYWALHESAGLWFGDGRLHWGDARHEVSEALADFVRVRIYTLRGRVHRLIGEHRDGMDREYRALDNMDAFLAEFRRHAPHAQFGPVHNQWL
ncbi:hypothetical protein [Lysobacter silvisoli]|uniref:Uncharacterized protein n=1 Tax=Lysobacter silvisoli TaxID=2293254 RepID=A0A371JZI2_9GAMM|nr:hypothetical protein [Lysobacter silvisoli]RDZ27066.1 hypothetical protein DX914_12415 [Lysobacter silvisoli]